MDVLHSVWPQHACGSLQHIGSPASGWGQVIDSVTVRHCQLCLIVTRAFVCLIVTRAINRAGLVASYTMPGLCTRLLADTATCDVLLHHLAFARGHTLRDIHTTRSAAAAGVWHAVTTGPRMNPYPAPAPILTTRRLAAQLAALWPSMPPAWDSTLCVSDCHPAKH